MHPPNIVSENMEVENIQEQQKVPGWTACNSNVHTDNIPHQSSIAYLPLIDAITTKYRTVNIILKQAIVKSEQLSLTNTLVFDQANMYTCKGSRSCIVWERRIQTCSSETWCLSHIYDLSECDRKEIFGCSSLWCMVVFAPGPATAVLEGKTYNYMTNYNYLPNSMIHLLVQWLNFGIVTLIWLTYCWDSSGQVRKATGICTSNVYVKCCHGCFHLIEQTTVA